MAEHNKPLAIYYPEGNDFSSLFAFCGDRYDHWLRYKLELHPIGVDFQIVLGKNLYLKAIEMRHQKGPITLGYVIFENRTRLKPEFVGQNIPTLLKGGLDRSLLNETYRANLFAYCLDAYEIVDPTQIAGCDRVVMDCTFLNKEDRTDMTHFTLDEATALCKSVGVKHMCAAHLSPRYDSRDYDAVVDPAYVTVINPTKVNHL